MDRLDQLAASYLDGAATPAETEELARLLGSDPQRMREFLGGFEIDRLLGVLHGPSNPEAIEAIVAQVARETDPFVESVTRELQRQPEPEIAEATSLWTRLVRWLGARTKAIVAAVYDRRLLNPRGKATVTDRRCSQNALFQKAFRIAGATASLALIVGTCLWFFGPTMGEPVLAELKGFEITVERGTEFIPAANGTRLLPGDVLRTATNTMAAITFGQEKTRIELRADSELKLASWSDGKHLTLGAGQLEATVARQRPFKPMRVLTPQAEARVLGTEFTLTTTNNATRLDVAEGEVRFTRASDSKSVKVVAGNRAIVAPNYELAALPQTGGILREYWTTVPGVFVRNLEKDRRYPNQPDGRDLLKTFEAPSNWGDNYGLRLRGYVHPPVTDDYTFWIAGSDEFLLFVSPDDEPRGAACVGYGGNTRPRDFDRPQANEKSGKSPPIRMVAGRRYYIEALLKAGVGEDHLAVAWSTATRAREIVPGEFLSPLKPEKHMEKK